MHDATAELEQLLTRIAVALILLDGVFDRLLRQTVLQFEGCDRQAIDEQREIERMGGIVTAVAKLARYRVLISTEN
jgi:hypothetical protein